MFGPFCPLYRCAIQPPGIAVGYLSGLSMPKTRIMYIENKSASLNGPARIGRVTFSKTGKSISYGARTFQSLKGSGFKANYFDIETGERFWISGPRKDGKDRLYAGSSTPVEIDRDVAEEYWRDIRRKPWSAGLEEGGGQVRLPGTRA
jgi:hypothetical protein